MLRAWYYVLFLGGMSAYLGLATYSSLRDQKLLIAKQTFWSTVLSIQLPIFIAMFPLVVNPWILSGFFSLSFVVWLFVGFEVSAIVVRLSYRTLRTSLQDFGAALFMTSAELGMRFPRAAQLVFLGSGLLFLLVYFVSATWVYFTHTLHSPEAVKAILNVTMPVMLSSFVFYGPFMVVLMASSRLTDRTRAAVFVQLASSLFPLGVLTVFYMSLDNVHVEDYVVASWPALASAEGFLRWLPLVALIIVYLIALIVPYFIGLEGRRRNESSMYQAMEGWTNRVIDVVGIPSDRDVDQLRSLRDELRAEMETVAEMPIVQIAEKIKDIDPASANPQVLSLLEAHKRIKESDLRLLLYAFLQALDLKLDEMIGEYQRIGNDPSRPATYIELGRAFHDHFHASRGSLRTQLDVVEKKSVLTPVLARAAAVLGAAPVVLQYAQKILKFLPGQVVR